MIDIGPVLTALTAGRVEFIVIGGVAATLHGSARLTRDVDVVYRRTDENIGRLVATLAPLDVHLRGAPPGVAFHFDARAVRSGLNFTLTTKIGDVDVFGEAAGGGTYEKLSAHSREIEAYGVRFLCVDLPTLIELKRAAGRPRDLEAIAELEKLRLERDAP